MKPLSENEHSLNLRLLIWILLLSFGAGFVNCISLQSYNATVSHHTGNISKLVIHIYHMDLEGVRFCFLLIFSFLLGSMLCGILFADREFNPKKRYGILLMLCGMMYSFVVYHIADHSLILYCLGFLMGVQNAMFIYYKKILIRTSHFTGYLTDMGFEMGRMVQELASGDTQKLKQSSLKTLFFFGNVTSFCIGGSSGLIIQKFIGNTALRICGGFYFFLGLYYALLYHRKVSRTTP